ncbi:hypothetical protein HN903_02695 [archaeon]|jgi:hypothetical protein|nr:hypothetical protein [archaeon]MBT7128641.1 hypothetical protein [archaeon]
METESMTIDIERFNQLLHDVALIKEILVANQTNTEGELTDWVKKELAEARQIPDSENISLEELEEQIVAR